MPAWMRRNMSIIRGRNAADEGCYAEILCNYQLLATEAKVAQQAGAGMGVGAGAGAGQSLSSAIINRRMSMAPHTHQHHDAMVVDGGDFGASCPPTATHLSSFGEGKDKDKQQNVIMRTITNFARSEAAQSGVGGGHSDVHATIRELSNELDRAQADLHEKQNIIANLSTLRDRLESQVGEQNVKIANASMAALRLQQEAQKREEIISILKTEREGFISENDSLRKKAADSAREADKYRGDVLSFKEVEIALRQQVFDLESILSAIRRAEQEDERNRRAAAASSAAKDGESMMDVNEFLAREERKKASGSEFVDVSAPSSSSDPNSPSQQQQQQPTKSRFSNIIDGFLGLGKGQYNAATHNATVQAEAMQRQLRDQQEEQTFTQQAASFLGDASRGHTPASTVPTFASFLVERAHDGDLHALCFTESGKHVWTGGAEKAIKCWDTTSSGRMVVRLPCSGGFPLSLHSVGDVLAVGCSDGSIRVLETSRYRDRCQLTGHSEKVTTALLAPDALKLFSTATDRTIKRWAVSRELMEHTIMCVSGCNDISLMNDKLASAHHDGTVRIWDCRDCKPAGEVRNVHEKAISTVRWVGEGLLVASMGRDDTIKISDIRTMRTVHTIRDPQLRVASNLQRFDISVDGRFLCVGGANGNLLFFPTDGEALQRPTNSAPRLITGGHAGYIMNVAWNPEGKGVATVGSDKKLAYWR